MYVADSWRRLGRTGASRYDLLAMNASLHNSLLLRSLAELEVLRLKPEGFDVAQVLAQHISFLDAAALNELFGAHHLQRRFGATETSARQEYKKVRNAVESGIRQSCEGTQTGGRLSLPADHYPYANEVVGGFAPYRKYYQAHQQNIELKVRALRSKVRDIVAKHSSRLQQLSKLDSACEHILADLEAGRLSNVIGHLEIRFNTLREEHRRFMAQHGLPDCVKRWLSPTGWLNRFHQDLQTTLLAELDLRLLPVLGLIEAAEAQSLLKT